MTGPLLHTWNLNLTSSVVARVSTASSSEGGRTFRTATGGCYSVSATTRARGRM